MSSFIFSKSAIQESLTIMCKIWAKRGIYVGFDRSPCTNGYHVFLGTLRGATQEDLQIALAHAAHEVDHILHTRFTQYKEADDVKALANVIEDIRVDNIGIRETPGIFLFRQDGINALLRRGEALVARRDDPDERCVAIALYWELTDRLLGYRLEKSPRDKAVAAFVDRFGQKMFDRMMKQGLKGALGKQTKDAIRSARAIAKLFAKYRDDKAKSAFADLELSANGAAPGAKPGTEPDGKSGAQPPEDQQVQPGQGAADNQPHPFSEIPDSDMASHFVEVLTCLHNRTETDEEDGKVRVWSVANTPITAGNTNAFIREADMAWGAYSGKIRKSLQAKLLDKSSVCRAGLLVDPNVLARVAVGDCRVFRRDDTVVKDSIAVTVLVDRSGSMDLDLMNTAKISAYSICSLLESIPNCVNACYAFPGIIRNTVLEVKSFRDSVFSCASRFAGLKSFGFTPLAETMFTAATQLELQNKKRKMILVITDGLNCEPDKIRDTIRILEKQGFELLCLNIGSGNLNLFRHQRNITHASQMAKELSEMLHEYMKMTKLV